MIVPRQGIILTDTVDLAWLKSLEPQFYEDFIKFVVDTNTTRVCVGMDIHRDCAVLDGINVIDPDNSDNLYGGNIFFEDGHIEYSSPLNVSKNIKNHSEGVLRKKFRGNPRIISDKDDIEMINNLLKPWIKGLKYDL